MRMCTRLTVVCSSRVPPLFCPSLLSDQVTKLLCIPCMVLIESLFYNKTYSLKIKLTLVIVLLGVAIATVTDMELTALGSGFSVLAVLFTTQFQIWMGEKQKAHALNPMQINHSQSPPAALFCAGLAFIFEAQGQDPTRNVMLHTFQGAEVRRAHTESLESAPCVCSVRRERPLFQARWLRSLLTPPRWPTSFDCSSPLQAMYILASCFLALSVNLCTYGLIGKTSPVTFQVVGHAKTCLILLGGFLLFPLPSGAVLAKNLAGIALAFFGVVLYGDVKVKADRNPRGKDLWDLACPAAVVSCLEAGEPEGSVKATAQYAAVPLEATTSPNTSAQEQADTSSPQQNGAAPANTSPANKV